MTWGKYYWPYFLILSSVLFLIPEIIGLITNASNTLSEYCWRELNVHSGLHLDQHGIAWWLSLVAWLLFVVVITAHIWYKSIP